MSALHLGLGIGVLFAGALVQSTVGFGAALFSVPVLLLVDPAFVPGPAVVAGLALNILMTIGHRAHTDRAGLRWIVVGLVPGSLVALAALRAVPSDDLAILSGAAVLVAVAITAVGVVPRKRPPTLVAAGLVSGFMGSTAAISGPPLALLYQRDDARTLRGTLPTAFLVSSSLALVMLSIADQMSAHDWLVGLALAPGGLAGFLVGGRWLTGRVEGSNLRLAVLVVSAASAALAIWRAVS